MTSLIEIYVKNGNDIFNSYVKYLSAPDYDLNLKKQELEPLRSLIENIKIVDSSLTLGNLNSFYVGYKIPQINKEFDLLRISDTSILNIEYKRKFTNKVEKQLLQNKYYLKFLDKKIELFTYVQKENKLFTLDLNETLIEVNYESLIKVLKNQKNSEQDFFEGNLNELFDPCNYLISPFRKTKEFINNEYFLTQEQEEVANDLIFNARKGYTRFLITGQAGSGKTLLTYHLAKIYQENKYKVGIIHVGQLNDGHLELCQKYGWNIQPIKNWSHLFSKGAVDIVIIDESQRVKRKYQKQIIEIHNECTKTNSILILSGDHKQTLANDEGELFEKISDSSKWIKFNLKAKVRTNKELANFIKVMLDLRKCENIKVSNKNINITYFETIKEAEKYISSKKYDYIYYTPSQYSNSPYTDSAKSNLRKKGSTHEVVGQEFENVIVILSDLFFYDEKKILKARQIADNPYSTLKMFFQQITRAISNLEIVVVNNMEVFNNLVEIFD